MNPREIKTLDDVRKILQQRKVDYVHIGLVDFNTQLRGKSVAIEYFLSGLRCGFPFDVDFYANVNSAYYSLPGLSLGGGDVHCQVVPESCREIPWEPKDRNLFFLLEYPEPNDQFDPRPICKKILRRAENMGFQTFHAHEYEFRIFNETSQSAYEKGYRDLISSEKNLAYKVLVRNMVWSEFFNALIDTMRQLDVRLESLVWETNFAEATIQYDEGIIAADNAVVFKNFLKAFALRREMMVTFMAKWATDDYGQSCHVHISLRDDEGNPVFYDPECDQHMSKTMRYFLGGLQKYLPEFMLMLAPNINSWKRFVPHMLCPIAVDWGFEDNKTIGLRAIMSSPNSTRIECRHAGADANPYLATACNLGAGLLGIEQEIEPSEPTLNNAWEMAEEIPPEIRLPETYRQAIDMFKSSDVAKELFGERFVEVFSAYADGQEREFRYIVMDQERKRFFEFV